MAVKLSSLPGLIKRELTKPKMPRRILMCILGVTIAGFSIGLFTYSALGMDPFQVFAHGIWRHIPLSFGTVYVILNALLLIADFFLDKHLIGLGTILNLFLVGYIADFSTYLAVNLLPPDSVLCRIIALIAALVIMCFASSLYFTADLGVSTYDAIAISLNRRREKSSSKFFRRWRFATIRIACDVLCVLIGALLCYLYDRRLDMAGALFTTMGIGTIITAFFMGPLISFFNRTVAEPLLKKT